MKRVRCCGSTRRPQDVLAMLLPVLWSVLLATAGTGQAATSEDGVQSLDSDPHLQGRWNLVGDASTEVRVVDLTSHGRHATARGGLEPATSDDREGAMAFQGGDGFQEVTGYKGVSGPHPRTLAAWIKTEKPAGEILSWGQSDFGQMWTFGFIRARLGVSPKGGYYYMQDGIHDDVWHHVAVVVQEAEAPNLHDDVTLYLDGEPAVVHDIGLLDLWPIDTGAELDVRIGRGFVGRQADIRIYDRPLSEEEIRTLHQTTARGVSPPDRSP